MKYCKKCKADNPEDARYCHMCGKRFYKINAFSGLLYFSVIVQLLAIIMFLIGQNWIAFVSIIVSFIGMFIYSKKTE